MCDNIINTFKTEIEIFNLFKSFGSEQVYHRPVFYDENGKLREFTDILVLDKNVAFIIEVKHFEQSKNIKHWKSVKTSICKAQNQVNTSEDYLNRGFKVYMNKCSDVDNCLSKGEVIDFSNIVKVFKLCYVFNVDKIIRKYKKVIGIDYSKSTTNFSGLLVTDKEVKRSFEYRYDENNLITILTEEQNNFLLKHIQNINQLKDYLCWKEIHMLNTLKYTKEQGMLLAYSDNFTSFDIPLITDFNRYENELKYCNL